MITVRLKSGKKVVVREAVYVVVQEGGDVVLLDGDRKAVRQFPWGDVIAHSPAASQA